jgi:hypothetical protein
VARLSGAAHIRDRHKCTQAAPNNILPCLLPMVWLGGTVGRSLTELKRRRSPTICGCIDHPPAHYASGNAAALALAQKTFADNTRDDNRCCIQRTRGATSPLRDRKACLSFPSQSMLESSRRGICTANTPIRRVRRRKRRTPTRAPQLAVETSRRLHILRLRTPTKGRP